MSLTPDPGICTISNLRGFGERIARSNSKSDGYADYGVRHETFESFVRSLKGLIHAHDGVNGYGIKKRAIIQAVTTSEQPVAEGYLKELGFTQFQSGSFPKYDHLLSVWCMDAPEFYNRVHSLVEEFDKKGK